MWYLYLGYLATQLYGFIEVLSGIRFVWSVHFFSTIVFVVWTFFPVAAYVMAKWFGAKGELKGYQLLLVGLGIGLFEKALYQFHVLSFYQNNTGALISGLLMFATAFITLRSSTLKLTLEH
ncbi:hypothetical protein [Thalassotalea sp. G2M2-11]|uniref:hypothetical protein n=1 Tax=Thalassotalea sp. G2M2-11 TaxID=2787627 RepID=UPI0019CFB90B|nr:hypothetical protein [Thalassotalea sp. G2M2-11]